MPRGEQKAVPEGKGPISQKKTGDNFLNEFRRLLQEFKQDFDNNCDEFKQQLGEYGKIWKNAWTDGWKEGSTRCWSYAPQWKRGQKEIRLASVKKAPS